MPPEDPPAPGDPLTTAGRSPEESQVFAAFARDHAAALEGLFRRKLGDAESARDLAQETLLAAWRGRSGYDPTRPLRPWVFRIGINLLRNHLRRRRLEREKVRPLTSEPPASEGEAASRDDAALEARRVERAVARLPAPQREVVVLRYQEERSCAEIATMLGITPNAVSVRLHHARRALQAILEEGA